MYETKIRESIYGVTGRNDTSHDVVQLIEGHVLSYLSTVKAKFEEECTLRLQRKEGRARKPCIDDLYAALAGTPEQYGVKRSVIVKTMARKATEDVEGCGADSAESYHSQLQS